MSYKQLYILVEGDDDLRLFNNIIKPKFQNKYDWVYVRPHSYMKKKFLRRLLRSIKQMNADYIYTEDLNNANCVTQRKYKIKKRIKDIDENNIVVVVKQIEGWYLAGLNDKDAKKFKLPPLKTTDYITKERFNNLIPQKFTRRDFMSEILKFFSIKEAKKKNKSFKYFGNRYRF